ncbi:PREDICTED: chymotrypsin A-like [Branchiostoma belcheri]|uniref:Chymotrypsin A-like n=1 Tax=Branchiostoma belcheri TaxID=7741 RepID=A0A6P4ZBS2_BRABE|nr:PREDICTED: chymotrypsin A-like [Branchiostoma belcheri]
MTRVVGGEDAAPHSWPWQVSLQTADNAHYCGGVLVHEDWVLTAGHCLRSDFETHKVILGEHDRTGDTEAVQEREIEYAFRHELYDFQTIQNDVMLLKLRTSAVLGDTVSAVCLPEQGETPSGPCWITGWGLNGTNAGDGLAVVLQQAELSLISDGDCGSLWGPVFNPACMICAGAADKGGCMGDSGGPLVCENSAGGYDVIGLVSFGERTCDPFYPTGFARVAAFRDWIEQIMTLN